MTSGLEAFLTAYTGITPTPPPADLVPYAARLYERRSEGVIVRPGKVIGPEWTPAYNDCHANVNALCEHDPRYRPVRGWLYFDFDQVLSFVRFTAHSVLIDENGRLWDITPSQASQPYPFIRAEGSEAEYVEIVETRGCGNLDYFR